MKPDSIDHQSDSSLDDQAIDWLVRLHSGCDPAQARAAFAAWRAASAEHESAARGAEVLWNDLSATRHARDFVISPARRKTAASWWMGVVAAAAMLLVLVGIFLQAKDVPWLADYRTATGERERIVLADGSVVHLDTATALSVSYGPNRRELVLHQGQALFEVVSDPQRPFVVKAGDNEVRAVGTVFQVQHRAETVNIVVTEGLVDVSAQHQAEAPLRLRPGQGADKSGVGSFVPQPADPGIATAWQRGKLIFNRRPLAEVVSELERYSPGLILLADEKLARLEVTGVFELDDIDASLAMITRNLPVELTRLPYLTLLH